jgi:glycine dehydrogenase
MNMIQMAWERGAMTMVAADLSSVTCSHLPVVGADITVGSARRFGVPLLFGGPHAAHMAVRTGHERTTPGRLVGVSVYMAGAAAYRLMRQRREQHIRRSKGILVGLTAPAQRAPRTRYAVLDPENSDKQIGEITSVALPASDARPHHVTKREPEP